MGTEQAPLTAEARKIAAMVDRMKDKDRYFILKVCSIIFEDYAEKSKKEE